MNSRSRESHLGLRSKAGGEEARRALLEGNLLRVVGAAKRYRGPKLSIEDLTQETGVGPTKAVDKFDPDKGYGLSAYATWWIRLPVGRKPTEKEDG